MGMFSEITTEGNIRDFVAQIQIQLSITHNPEARAALTALALRALDQFEWDTPDWALELKRKFNASKS